MLVCEFMLQQTQVARVVPVWERFIAAFPSPAALAEAPLADVLRAWKGLGYNRRAANLWRAAGVIVAEHGGRVPASVADLRRLPGVGAYTAAAVASCAYGVPVAAVDTNLRRVVARVRLGVGPDEAGPAEIASAAQAWLDRRDPGAWNQALMDLGREVCRPVPACAACPLRGSCRFRRLPATSLPDPSLPAPPLPAPPLPAPPLPAPPLPAPPLPAPPRSARRVPAFEGSSRQLRGRIIEVLREVDSASLGAIARRWDEPVDRVSVLVAALAAEGLVRAGPAALAGRPGGRVSLGS